MPGAAQANRIENSVNLFIAKRYPPGGSWSEFAAYLLRCTFIVEIRIDTSTDGQRTIVWISGRMAGAMVEQVREVCDRIEGEKVLQLTHLVSIDDDGIDLIRALGEAGVEACGATPYIRYLLDDTN